MVRHVDFSKFNTCKISTNPSIKKYIKGELPELFGKPGRCIFTSKYIRDITKGKFKLVEGAAKDFQGNQIYHVWNYYQGKHYDFTENTPTFKSLMFLGRIMESGDKFYSRYLLPNIIRKNKDTCEIIHR